MISDDNHGNGISHDDILDDKCFFMDELPEEKSAEKTNGFTDKRILDNAWKIMIVDDAKDVHNITRMVFEDYYFEGKGIDCLSAYSGKQAKELIELHPETAVILLDVVMETDRAGLDLVRYIREELNNRFVRIILRTGQPGQAPEKKVILKYDINDYKTKEDLTNRKLFTSVTAALRSFRDIKSIEKSRNGLKMIIDATADFLKFSSLKQFTHSILHQVTSIPWIKKDSLLLTSPYINPKATQTHDKNNFQILAGMGCFGELVDKSINDINDNYVVKEIKQAFAMKTTFFDKKRFVCYFKTINKIEIVLYFKNTHAINNIDRTLIDIFLSNLSMAFDIFYHRLNLEKLVRERTSQLTLEKEKVAKAHFILSKYVPIQLSEKIMADEIGDIWEHSRKKLTLFFSDIKNFTGTTESMEPEDMAGLLNEYLTAMYDIADNYEGLVANVKGDELFIFFGASEKASPKEEAIRCVDMAVAMQKKMVELKTKWFNEGICEPLQIRCGINTGMVNVGGFGSKNHKNFTAMGMQVNLASRLETAGKPGGILISHSTWALVREKFDCSARGKIKVKGFSHPVIAYDIIF